MSQVPMFISRLMLLRGAGSIGALATLLREGADAGRAHQLLWTLFGDHADRRRDFLFRAGDGPDSPDGDFLAVSPRPPRDEHGLWRIESKLYEPQLIASQLLAFKLRANPTVTRKGKRHDVVMDRKRALGRTHQETNAEIWESAGRDWLNARAPRLGIELKACRADGYRVHRLGRSGGGLPVSFASLDLSGQIRVIDPEKLRHALFIGVGHGKAYGCGMLLVKPM
jgi:CRISPR system Cascade subunit CasE